MTHAIGHFTSHSILLLPFVARAQLPISLISFFISFYIKKKNHGTIIETNIS